MPALALLNTRKFGGYAGTRVGDTQSPGPATHERDWTAPEQVDATHRRINEGGDSVPSSQDSVAIAVQNLCISDSPATSAALSGPPPPTMRNARRPPQPKQQPREPVADAHLASTDGGLVQHMEQKHGGHLLVAESVGQLRWLSRQVGVFCGTVRSQRCRRCNSCGFDTPLRELRVGDTFQDRRQRASGRSGQRYGSRSAPCLRENHWTTARLRTAPSETSFSLAAAHRDSPGLGDGTFAESGLSIRHGLGRKSRRSHEWSPVLGLLCRYRCRLLLAEIPKGV